MAVPRVRIYTLGCKVNQCDSEEIARSLAARGYEVGARGDSADIFIVNTCTVTATADAKARKLIRRLARAHPEATLIATGCIAESDPHALLELPGVTAVIPNSRKLQIADFLPELQAPMFPKTYLPSRTRSFLKIQDGCDHRCAYCAVPDARGRPMSKPFKRVLEAIASLADTGAKEIVLCGIRLGAYGADRGDKNLADVLRSLRKIGIPRVRLSSIEPMDLDEAILEEIADHPTLCHHLHLPVQSGDDGVLAAMGRGYSTADFVTLVSRIRRAWPDVALTTDVMVGFPGETDAQFERTLSFIREMAFTRLHVFPYSPRPGTPAADHPDQVAAKSRKSRADRMLALAEELSSTAASEWVGTPVSVLVEEKGRDKLLAVHTPHYFRVHFPGSDDTIGRIVTVTPTCAESSDLYADR